MDSFFLCSFSILSAGIVVFIGDSTQICTNIIAIIHIFFLYKMLVFFADVNLFSVDSERLKFLSRKCSVICLCAECVAWLRICENRIWAFFYILISVYLVFIIQVKLNWLLLSVVPRHATPYHTHTIACGFVPFKRHSIAKKCAFYSRHELD